MRERGQPGRAPGRIAEGRGKEQAELEREESPWEGEPERKRHSEPRNEPHSTRSFLPHRASDTLAQCHVWIFQSPKPSLWSCTLLAGADSPEAGSVVGTQSAWQVPSPAPAHLQAKGE